MFAVVALGFVAFSSFLQSAGVSNHVLPLVKDWWGSGGGHPSYSAGQNMQCILAIQDGFAGPAQIDTAVEAFKQVISAKCGASIQHRLDMFVPPSDNPTFGFECRAAARASCGGAISSLFSFVRVLYYTCSGLPLIFH